MSEKCADCGRPAQYDAAGRPLCGPCQRFEDGYINEDALWDQAVSARAERREQNQPEWAR